MAIVTSTGTVTRVEDDVDGTPTFSYLNNEYGIDRHGVGDQGKNGWNPVSNWKFTMDVAIPARSKITSAIIRGPAYTTNSLGLVAIVQYLLKDGVWNVSSAGPMWRRISLPSTHIDYRVKLVSTGAATLFDHSSEFNGGTQGIRSVVTPAKFDRLSQGLTVTTAGTLGTATMKLGREGSPTGNVWIEVYSQDGSGFPGTLLATSDTRLCSALSTDQYGIDFSFTFSGANQISLSQGQAICVVLRSDCTVDGVNFPRANWTGGGADQIPGGHPATYGTGWSFDNQNYPADTNYQQIPASSENIAFIAPAITADVNWETPELYPIIQGLVNRADWVSTDPIGIKISGFQPYTEAGAFRDFKSPGLQIIVKWKEHVTRTSR